MEEKLCRRKINGLETNLRSALAECGRLPRLPRRQRLLTIDCARIDPVRLVTAVSRIGVCGYPNVSGLREVVTLNRKVAP